MGGYLADSGRGPPVTPNPHNSPRGDGEQCRQAGRQARTGATPQPNIKRDLGMRHDCRGCAAAFPAKKVTGRGNV